MESYPRQFTFGGYQDGGHLNFRQPTFSNVPRVIPLALSPSQGRRFTIHEDILGSKFPRYRARLFRSNRIVHPGAGGGESVGPTFGLRVFFPEKRIFVLISI